MMCNAIHFIMNIKGIFKYLFFLSIVQQIHSKSIKKYDECDKFADSNDCYYFPCLDAHYSCGRDNHLARFSYDLCLLTTEKYASKLTLDARYYFNHTNQCAMISLHNRLIEEKISAKFSCTHLQKMISDIYLDCFQNKQHENKQRENQNIKIIDFCSITCDNLQPMIDLFLNINSGIFNLNYLLIQTGKNCGAQVNDAILHNIASLLMSICLDRKNVQLKYDITNIMFNPRFEPTDYEWI